MPPMILLFDTGNSDSVKLNNPGNYECFIPLVDIYEEAISTEYQLRIYYNIDTANTTVTCGIELINNDYVSESFSVSNVDVGYYYDSITENALNYFIGGGDTIKYSEIQEAGDSIIKNNLLIIDFIHAELVSGNTYHCYHHGVAFDLKFLKDMYGLELPSN